MTTQTTLLSRGDLRRMVPAAFAIEPSANTSDRYAFVPTTDVIDRLEERGWFPVRAKQSSRSADLQFCKHMITFRRPDTKVQVGDVHPEVTQVNAHNATKMWNLFSGFFRLVCSNGLIVGTGIGETRFQRIHLDGAKVDIDLALDAAVTKLDENIATIERWTKTELDWGTRQEFARDAIVVRNAGDKVWSNHFDPMEFLNRRRQADKGNDLWTIFNVVQENCLKGGVQGPTRMLRAINQVSPLVRINMDLWNLAQTYDERLNGLN